MSITPALFKTRFPEFGSIDSDRIQIFIDDSVTILNESFWGDKYDLGLYYLSAHFLRGSIQTAAGSGGASNPITSQSVDGTSISFSIPTANDGTDAYYESTAYGQRYLALRRSLGSGAQSV